MATNFLELSHHLSLAEGDGMLGMAPLGVSSILLLIGVKSPRPKRLGSQSRRTAQRWRNSTVFSQKKIKKTGPPVRGQKIQRPFKTEIGKVVGFLLEMFFYREHDRL